VIACNTASVSLPALREALAPLPVIGVIEPGAAAALAAAPEGPIGVIATEGTVKGGAYRAAIRAAGGANVPIAQQACPLFVPMAEEGLVDGPIVEAVIHRYLDPLLATVPKPKALLLGCTHYPVLKAEIAKTAGSDVTLVDSAVSAADAVAKLLSAHDILNSTGGARAVRFLATDAPDRFANVGEIFLGQPIDPGAVELIDLQ
jgi:glutamate racemase